MKKRVISLLLAATLLCTSFIGCSNSSSSESSDDTSSSSSTDSSDEEEEEVEQTRPITLVVGAADTIGTVEDLYCWKYLDYLTDIEFEVTHILDVDSSLSTYKQLAFASGTMDDIMLRFEFSTADITLYGVNEGQLVSFTEYIEDGTMPYLAAAFEAQPDALTIYTAPDGGIYSLGNIEELVYEAGALTGTTCDYSIRTAWLEEANLDVPETLDEFIDMLRAFKSMYPDSIPLGCSYEYGSAVGLIASALGIVYYNSQNSEAFTEVALVDGEATFIWGDQELYEPFLQTYITMYEEGLISQDFFTTDQTTVKALAAASTYGVVGGSPIVTIDSEHFTEYECGIPMTSDYNDTQMWTLTQSNYTIGVGVITSNCENPELAAELLDYFYDPETLCRLADGPLITDDEEIKFGLTGQYIAEGDATYTWTTQAVEDGLYGTTNNYRDALVSGMAYSMGYSANTKAVLVSLFDMEYETPVWDLTTAAGWRRQGNYDNLVPYEVMGYPEIVYFDLETSETLTDLSSVIVDYAEMQFAQFVTGQRSIDELDDYFAELDAMGYQEYLAIYYDYYESTK